MTVSIVAGFFEERYGMVLASPAFRAGVRTKEA
jgi:hypothetical protein